MKKIIIGLFVLIFLLALGIPMWVVMGLPNQPYEVSPDEPTVKVLNAATGEQMELPLEQYLIGVVAAEMPANFEMDALKSQAVAARTYTAKRMLRFGGKPSEQHPESEVCTDATHCQAWLDEDQLKEKWGKVKFFLYRDKIKTAVEMTRGQVITYQTALIDPVYHSSCGGIGTESSEDVWANVIPYLRSVSCSLEYKQEENVFTVDLNKQQVVAALKDSASEGQVAAALAAKGAQAGEPIEPVKRSGRGRLQEVKVFGQTMSGIDLRKKLGLTSTSVTWKVAGEKITFTSIGKGHAVGMCQYGANGMALAAMTYGEILKHYYTGVKLQKLKY